MAAIKAKSRNRSSNGPISETESLGMDHSLDVLTASEAAAYLRVKEADIVRLAQFHGLPGRQIGNEWRFLKEGLQDWLRTPAPASGKEAMLALAGAWKDDPDIEAIVRRVHRRRGRPSPENA